MRSLVRSPTATLAHTFHRAIRNGAEPSSDRFLAFAADRVSARGGLIAHLDLTIVRECPQIHASRRHAGQHRQDAGIDARACCSEGDNKRKLGFIGRGEGIVAYATATVRLPWG